MTEVGSMPTDKEQPLPPVKIAFILDGVVQDVLHTDNRLGAIFLSEPTIVDVTEWYAANTGGNLVGTSFDGASFILSSTEE